ncbi:hypothetical protein ACOBWA_01345 [Psychrobacter sp. ER1]|uniref:hypothetical protein n=1 Tax=Psychrobacter sp. ER1 TaxID=3406645 RepID=UPI003B42D6BE
MYQAFQKHLQQEISDIRAAGLYKNERVITSPQDALIKIADGREMLNFCANNYLGLSDHPEIKRRRSKPSKTQVTACHRCGLFVVRKICISN